MKKIILGLMLFVVALSAQAQEKKNKNAKYEFDVNGNCEMCKKRIEKAAFGVAGVKSATWSIEDHTMQVIVNEEKNSNLEVKKAIANVGHDTDDVKATDEVYKKLHGCCAYNRE